MRSNFWKLSKPQMKIFVKVKPNAREEKIKKIDGTHFEIRVKEPAKEGRANNAVLEQLALIFGISKLRFRIVSGKSSKQKIIEIP